MQKLTQLSGDWMATMARKYEHSESGTAAEERITRLPDLCYIKQANGSQVV